MFYSEIEIYQETKFKSKSGRIMRETKEEKKRQIENFIGLQPCN